MINIGSAIYFKLPFADGGSCDYKRSFLVLDINEKENKLTLLNVSKIKDKVRKTLFNSNVPLEENHRPPLPYPSFVKIDAIYEIEYYADLDKSVMMSGKVLDINQFQKIKNDFTAYTGQKIMVSYKKEEIVQYNQMA